MIGKLYLLRCALLLAIPIVGVLEAQDSKSDEVRRAVVGLSSEDTLERERASERLKVLGRVAVDQLRIAAQSSDAEVAARSRALLKWIIVDDQLSSRLKAAFPRLADRLAHGDPHEWTKVLLDAARLANRQERATDGIRTTDLAPLIVPALRAATDEEERTTVCRLAGRTSSREAIPQLLVLLKDDSVVTRREAAFALGKLGSQEGLCELQTALRSESSHVRLDALDALSCAQARQAIPDIVKMLEDKDDAVRLSAVETLLALRAMEALPQLVRSCDDSSVLVRGTLTRGGLQSLGGSKLVPLIIPLLRDGSSATRRGAARALMALDAIEVANDIADLLDDRDAGVRCAAVDVLAELDGRNLGLRIAQLLEDTDPRVCRHAILALASLGADEAAKSIASHLDKEDASVRESAIQALSAFNAVEFLPSILQQAQRESNVRRACADAIGKLKAVDASHILTKLLADPEPSVRASAIAAIARLNLNDARSQMETALRDSEAVVRRAAASALCVTGSFRGAEEMLKLAGSGHHVSLFPLNALRQPEAWKQLGGKPLSRDLRVRASGISEAFQKEFGVRVEIDPSTAASLDQASILPMRFRSQGGKLSLRDAIENLDESRIIFLLERDSIKVMTQEQGVTFWTVWCSEKAQKERR